MEEDVFKAALAGLLHDIGKFAQRAREGHHIRWDGESETEFKYEHALYTDDVLSRLVPEKWRGEMRGPAGRHHRPQTHLERVVALADHLSAGELSDSAERQPKRLLSIFCRLSLDGQTAPEQLYWPLKPLAIAEDTLFPVHRGEDDGTDAAYRALWDGFVQEAETLRLAHEGQKADLATYLEELLALMQRYTWCIRAAYYRAIPDVSLYDHSRMTAALSVCLAGQEETAVADLLKDPRRESREIALLVSGDLSGVQNFIYTITSRGATSALRGRSFYLQLLTEAVARYLLRKLTLPITNLVYASGGRFYLLARPDDAEKLSAAQKYVSQTLLHHHGGDLYLAVEQIPLAAADFFGGHISDKWDEVNARLRRAKERRFSELGDNMHRLLFELGHDEGNREKECHVCGREHKGTKKIPDPDHPGLQKCPQCVSYEDLGEDLRSADYLRLDEIEPSGLPDENEPPGKWPEVLAAFGMAAAVGQYKPERNAQARRSLLLALKDESLEKLSPEPDVAIGRRFLVNVTPSLEGRVKTFEELENDAKGIKRLGVLRMDVDDMGRLFSEGFRPPGGENVATLSRVATLSFFVSLFFEGWVGRLAGQVNSQGTDRLYSIYSGGDDLFFVGSWDAIPELTLEIRNDFARYTARHPAIHLSAGIALVGGKYPLYQAAADAGEAEAQAKHLGKDSITFLGQTVKWDRFVRVKDWKDRMQKMLEDNGVPRSLLQTLMTLQQQHDDAARKRSAEGRDRNLSDQPQTCYGPWIPRVEYMLNRMQKRHKEAKEELQKLRDDLKLDSFSAISWIGLAARWAELLERK